jgi:DnaK suppressor protein
MMFNSPAQGAEQVSRDLDKARALLLALREELHSWSASTAEDRETVTLDQTTVGRLSRVDSLQQQAMAQATERHRTAELNRIDAALKRIDDDEYGYCIECGDEISDKRLEIDPSATHCIACAK